MTVDGALLLLVGRCPNGVAAGLGLAGLRAGYPLYENGLVLRDSCRTEVEELL